MANHLNLRYTLLELDVQGNLTIFSNGRSARHVNAILIGLILEKSVPGCLDKESAALLDFCRDILALPYDKEHVIDGLPRHDLSLFPSA